MQKLVKHDEPIFLATIRTTDEVPQIRRKRGGKKRSPVYVAVDSTAHGMTERMKRKTNKESGTKKDIITVAEREREVLDSVPVCHWETLEKIIHQYRDVLLEKTTKGVPG